MWRTTVASLVMLGCVAVSRDAHAVRPFVTDDARVVGKGHVQLETWWRRDDAGLQHWAVAAAGPTDRIELSLGFVHGVANEKKPTYSIAGPLFQGKFLVHAAQPNRWPGIAAVFGVIPPWGMGGFESDSWTLFSYLCITELLFDDERVAIHGNLGFAGTSSTASRFSWGVATEIRIIGLLHAMGELYSGDPYIAGVSGTTQFGFRFVFSDHLQLDATAGLGVFADRKEDIAPPFVGTGVRLVSHEWW